MRRWYDVPITGSKFITSTQTKALCRQVMAVYAGRQWAFVEEHIHDTLGKQLVAAGEGPAALPHFLAQLPCPFNSPDWQQYYLEQFLGTLRDVQAEQVRDFVLCTSWRHG